MKEAYLPLPERKTRSQAGPAVGAGLVVVVSGWLALRSSRPAAVPETASPPPAQGSAPAPSASAPAPDLSMPSPGAAQPQLAAAVSALPASLPLMNAELANPARTLASTAVWARVTPQLLWRWPAHVAGFNSGAFAVGMKAAKESTSRRLAGWFPSNAPAQQVQLSVIGEDGAEAKLYEAEEAGFAAQHSVPIIAAIMGALGRVANAAPMTREQLIAAAKAHHEDSMKTLRARAGVVGVKDVSPDGQMVGDFELTFKDGHKERIRYDPLVFDLRGIGVQTDDRHVLFDLYGYHKDDKVQWMNDVPEGMGILVFDPRGTGKAGGTGGEVFGDRTDLDGAGKPTGFANGYEALRGLVDRAVARGVLSRADVADGVLDAGALVKLEEAYGLKMKVGGFNKPAISLAEAGIKAIALSNDPPRRVEDFDGRRNDLLLQPGAVFLRADGTTGHYMNLWLAAKTGGTGLGK